MLDIQSRRIVIGNRAAIGETAVAVLALRATCDGRWSAITTVATLRRVLIESCCIDEETPTVRQDCASAGGAGVERLMSAKAVRPESITAAAARGVIQIKS